MLNGDERLAVCESEIKNIKSDIAELYIKGDETNKNYNKVNLEYNELSICMKGMTKSIDNMILEMKEDRTVALEKIDNQNLKIEKQSEEIEKVKNKVKNKDGDTAKSIVKWIIDNIGGIAIVLLTAFIVFKFGWK